MATLFNTKIKDTYQSLLKLEDNTILTTTSKNITDGLGNASPLYLSTTRVGIGTNAPTSALTVNGSISFSSYNNTIASGTFPLNAIYTASVQLCNLIQESGGVGITFKDSGGSAYARFGFPGNLNNTIGQSTFGVVPDLGARLGVRGSGSTSATTSLLVQNSAGSTAVTVKDDLTTTFGGVLTIQIPRSPTSNILRFNPPTTDNINSVASIEYLYNGGASGGPRINMNGSAVCINNVSGFQSLGGIGALGVRTLGSGSGYTFGILNGDGTNVETEFRNGFDFDGNLIFRNNSTIRATSTTYASGGTLNVQGGQPRSDVPNGNGGNLALNGGLGQGTGTAGNIIFSTSTATTSGTTLQTLSERMRIDGSGNVGIGTTAPSMPLDVIKSAAISGFNIRAWNNAGNTGLPATSGTTQNGGTLRLGRDNAVLDFGSSSSSGAWIQSTNQGNLSANYDIYLNPNGGNIQVGTTTGTAKLSIKGSGSTSATTSLLVQNSSSTTTFSVNDAGELSLGSTAPKITLGGNLLIENTISPTRKISIDVLNSNLNLIVNGFGEGYFIGNRLTGSPASSGYVSPNGINEAGGALITAYDGNGNISINASNNGNRSIVLKGLGLSGAVLIGNITTGNGTQYDAILRADSTTQGFLPPRMTTAQKNAIVTPAAGLMIFDTDLARPCFFNGATWITL